MKKSVLRKGSAVLLAFGLTIGMMPLPVWAQTVTGDSTNASYSSTTGGENAVLVSGGSATLTSPTVTKSGDSSDENADFTGTNAAVLCSDGTLTITDGSVTTGGSHANGVFAYSKGTVNISRTSITTSANNSGGIMTTGGATMNAKNLTVNTSGGSSAAIRSDRGGGDVNVEGGTYTTSGTGSPAIYSTADIDVSNASLTSNTSEAVVIEGANSVSLKGCTVTADNNKLNGQATDYDNVLIYQSMSGDAAEGSSEFDMTEGTMTCRNGEMFCVTNTTCTINLTNASLVNSGNDLLVAEAQKWGKSGSNGGKVTLNASSQKLEGTITVDSISSLVLNLKDSSSYTGAINTAGTSGSVSVSVASGCTWTLSGDSYVSSLSNEGKISTNGHTLYVNGTAYDGGSTADVTESRVAGNDRYDTSARIASSAYPSGTDCAVIALGSNFADALSASSFAGLINAPVLLNECSSTVNSYTQSALKKLNVKKIVLIGGTSALPAGLASALESEGYAVKRIYGSTRTDTSYQIYKTGEAVASELTGETKTWNSQVIVASGVSPYDALSVSPYAAGTGTPILLTESDGTLSSENAAAVGIVSETIIVGGTAVVSSSVESAAGGSCLRLGGSSRFATSADIAAWMIGKDSAASVQPSTVFGVDSTAFATGADGSYADALCGSVLQAVRKSPLLLMGSGTAASAVLDFAKEQMGLVTGITVLGGTSAVPENWVLLIRDAISG